jgi:diacylglycerol O-acyltransferase
MRDFVLVPFARSELGGCAVRVVAVGCPAARAFARRSPEVGICWGRGWEVLAGVGMFERVDVQRDGIGRRLSPLDGSFLRLDSPRAHMHVGFSGVFGAPLEGDRPTLLALRERVAGRLHDVPWCRWRLQGAPLGLSEPRWVDDREFDLAAHVLALSEPEQRVPYGELASLRDAVLSRPLDRSRAPWQIFLIPRLEDGRVGMIGKIHHALVDGIAALQIVGLVADAAPDAPSRTPGSWRPAGEQGPLGWAIDGLTQKAGDGLRALQATAAAAARPRSSARAVLRGAGRVLLAAREDILPRAPASALNVPIGSRRSLVGYHAPRTVVRAARSRGGTLNDVGLTVVAGALRALALRRGEPPTAPLKAMVPVSMRRADEAGPGNRIALVYIRLPVNLASPHERLDWVRAQTARLKGSGRPEGTQTVYGMAGLLPAPLRSPLTRAMASGRSFTLTISQSPAPRGPLHMLGCELQEVFSVVPIAQEHALAIGLVRYRQELFFGCYADPDALPEARELPALLEAEMNALGRAAPPPAPANRTVDARPFQHGARRRDGRALMGELPPAC